MFAVNGEGLRKASAETRDETRFRVGLLPAASGGCVSVLLFATPHLDVWSLWRICNRIYLPNQTCDLTSQACNRSSFLRHRVENLEARIYHADRICGSASIDSHFPASIGFGIKRGAD